MFSNTSSGTDRETVRYTCECCGNSGNEYLVVNGLCTSCRADNDREFYEQYDEEQDRIF